MSNQMGFDWVEPVVGEAPRSGPFPAGQRVSVGGRTGAVCSARELLQEGVMLDLANYRTVRFDGRDGKPLKRKGWDGPAVALVLVRELEALQ